MGVATRNGTDKPTIHLAAAAKRAVRQRIKERWEKRDTEKWCGYCRAPEPKSKCGGCGDVWFCNKKHQKTMWSFHKGYCNKC